jgi:hypothetical protein
VNGGILSLNQDRPRPRLSPSTVLALAVVAWDLCVLVVPAVLRRDGRRYPADSHERDPDPWR